jgi:dTDP-4-amino-4,6-dideoxygalactose transaminase
MDKILRISKRYKLILVEDAAQAIMSKYKGKHLGTIGDVGCISFHETKNIQCGEGGAIILNRSKYVERAEIIREKGTNRSKFYRGEVNKYTWVDIGSSYLPSELNAAFLYAQLESINKITKQRIKLSRYYFDGLKDLEKKKLVELPKTPNGCMPNGHVFFLKTKGLKERTELIGFLKQNGIMSVFHYIPLHSSIAGKKLGCFKGKDIFTTKESERILRLPMYYGLKIEQVYSICQKISEFYLK